ncbi:type I-E CRISPR-associated protein Cse2/CasB [Actinoplanes sp. NPDC049668]|uniref:type I-E CRISPR-associated protein Cse2/CasB n=1 Tax=unclassified Actinoplanes TaxID=2626549 RepID=UPI0033B99466
MTDYTPSGGLFWQRYSDGEGRWRSTEPSGAHLAALRRGLGRQAGDVPEMWPFYSQLRPDGSLSYALNAEHVTLSLFALHQQGKARPMHANGIGLGTAMLRARDSGLYSSDGIDRRFSAAATASGLTELTGHLRGLITQLRNVEAAGKRGQPLDYTQLYRDLRNWQYPDRVTDVRRRWGSQYFATRQSTPAEDPPPPATA